MLTGHVLIVDDDADTRGLLVAMLVAEGLHVLVAEDGLEGLHLLRTVRHREPDTPCFVLLDLNMPRLSGSEFRRAQLADPVIAAVPVAIMSGVVDAADRARLLGAVATLAKPIDLDVLLEVVRLHCTTQSQA